MTTLEPGHAASHLQTMLQMCVPLPGNFELIKAATTLDFRDVLDVGFGHGGASISFALAGRIGHAITLGDYFVDLTKPHFDLLGIQAGDKVFLDLDEQQQFDAIWLSHMLEHTSNPGGILHKARKLLRNNGWLLVCVPPFKHEVVRGHLSVGWNLGLLMYNLLVAGFNITQGHFIRHGYNVCAFVRKDPALDFVVASHAQTDNLVEPLMAGDNARLYWPGAVCERMNAANSFDGNLEAVNWTPELAAATSAPLDIRVGPEKVAALLALGPTLPGQRAPFARAMKQSPIAAPPER